MNKKLVIITGASSGFGLEMAKLYSNSGYPTLLLARRIEKIKEHNFKNSIAKKVDVTKYQEIQEAIEQATNKYGQPDLLINNAGIMLLGDIKNQDPSEWKTMFDVNLQGILNATQLVLNDMIENNCGTIINISSVAGKKAFHNHAAYCATKYGVHGLTETIRMEVSSKNVRVLLIAPGAAETELLSHTTNKEIKEGYESWKTIMDDDKSLDPKYVAQCSKFMYELPQNVSIRELVIADTKQDQ